MARETILNSIKDAGVVGAGGAGFPTHIKLAAKADTVIANGAECEPLLRTDQQLMANQPELLLRGLALAMESTGAVSGVVALKAHYHDAVDALRKITPSYPGIRIHEMESYYPAGDEKSLIYDVTKRVVPTGKLPADVGVVVQNVNTLVNVALAAQQVPVTKKFVTVTGCVENPATYEVPIGTDAAELLAWAGAPAGGDYTLLVGGPCMGYLTQDYHKPITKTDGGLILFPSGHPYVRLRSVPKQRQLALAKAVCCQCSQCSQLCPRNALGLGVQPHKAMRAVAQGIGSLLGDPNAILACSSCGLCTYYSCNFGLHPSEFMTELKAELGRQGVRPEPETEIRPDSALELKKVPVARMIARMGLKPYDVPAPIKTAPAVSRVTIPLRQHIGAPSEPVVIEGASVHAGDLIAAIPEGKLGANVHASISGRVTRISSDSITLEA
ncbi:MAG: SLBB domain-containing protein [Clostridiales bacterium]|nr:SLBB domain-containing protein [Clostridiales bacterium]